MSTLPTMPRLGGSAKRPTVSVPVKRRAYAPQNLPYDDGEPMESNWHVRQMSLLIEGVEVHRGSRDDFFAGGNMFVYFSEDQFRNRDYRGPDFFLVNNVSRSKKRKYWALWDEGDRGPDLVVELMSKSTRDEDLTTKRAIYEKKLRVPEYVAFDPETGEIHAWRLGKRKYKPIRPDENGRIWLEQAGLWVGTWRGLHAGSVDTWLRFFDAKGRLVPTERESKLREMALKEQAISRAEAVEAELARLKAKFGKDA